MAVLGCRSLVLVYNNNNNKMEKWAYFLPSVKNHETHCGDVIPLNNLWGIKSALKDAIEGFHHNIKALGWF